MLLVIFVSIIFTWSVLDAVTQYNDVREMSIGNQPIKETMLTPKVAVDITNPNYLPNEAEEEL